MSKAEKDKNADGSAEAPPRLLSEASELDVFHRMLAEIDALDMTISAQEKNQTSGRELNLEEDLEEMGTYYHEDSPESPKQPEVSEEIPPAEPEEKEPEEKKPAEKKADSLFLTYPEKISQEEPAEPPENDDSEENEEKTSPAKQLEVDRLLSRIEEVYTRKIDERIAGLIEGEAAKEEISSLLKKKVLNVAERLVTEEIERIKAQVGYQPPPDIG
ncbi:MAG: hypothetical protein ACE5GM_01040 [bacterium]